MTAISGVGTQNNAAWLAAREENNKHFIDHENLHLATAGQYAIGGIHIDYDEKGWATAGHVDVRLPKMATAQQSKVSLGKTIEHAEAVAKSAMAPSDPSDQDYKVYSQVQQVLFQAQQLLREKKANPSQDKKQSNNEEKNTNSVNKE